MSENKMSEIIAASIEGIRSFTDMETAIGAAINTPSGVTVIPVYKVAVGFATGGVDYTSKKNTSAQNFGGGGGTGISITPIAFLTVGNLGEIRLIPLTESTDTVEKIVEIIERTPEYIDRIKNTFS